MPIYSRINDIIGNTPLLELARMREAFGLKARILAKLEYLNPTGSVKDRTVDYMLRAGLESGEITRGSAIIEATSGNTGIALSALACVYGLKAVIVMPENMSEERKKLIKFYGAELILTDARLGMSGAEARAKELKNSVKHGILLGQFEKNSNPEAHENTTAPEIWRDTAGDFDIFVAGAGTGGTLTGCSQFFKAKNPDIRVYAVEPYSSPVLSGGKSGAHGIQGIGAGFIPKTLKTSAYDGVCAVKDGEAEEWTRALARTEGLFSGLSSGAAMCACADLARREENAGKTIVTVFPDGGLKYLSVKSLSSGL